VEPLSTHKQNNTVLKHYKSHAVAGKPRVREQHDK